MNLVLKFHRMFKKSVFNQYNQSFSFQFKVLKSLHVVLSKPLMYSNRLKKHIVQITHLSFCEDIFAIAKDNNFDNQRYVKIVTSGWLNLTVF